MLFCRAPRPSGVVLFLRWDLGCANCQRALRTRRSRGAACGGASWAFVCVPWGFAARCGQLPVRAPRLVRPTVEHYYPGPLSGAGLGLSGAVRAAEGPCVTQGLANDGALPMPGTGAKHLAGGQPPIGRALHDFGCPRELVSFLPDSRSTTASFGRRPLGRHLARVVENPNPSPTRRSRRGITLQRSEFASC